MNIRDILIALGINPDEILTRAENLKTIADEAERCGERIIEILDSGAGLPGAAACPANGGNNGQNNR